MRICFPFPRAALVALLFLGAPQAFAQSCGDWVGGTVVLSGDLHCTSGWVALGIGADGTTIDLNGHTISGAASMFGLDVAGRDHVTIKGPGRIVGFDIGVRGGHGTNLRVENVRFDSVTLAVSENHGHGIAIVNNEFVNIGSTAVSIRTTPSHPRHSKDGLIEGNWFDGGETAVELCGMNTYGYSVKNNRITNQSVVAIKLWDEANNNTLFGNDVDFSHTALGLYNARENHITGERYTDGTIGIWAISRSRGPCATSGSTDVAYNTMERMSLFDLHTAVLFGGTGHGGWVLKNQLLGSKIYDNQRGVVLQSDTYGNVAVDNALFGTVTPILDSGIANETAPNYCDPPGC
ncbi:MAG: NosD domain-containing protein [Wenzhouxiangellaceae bacterium]